MVIDIFVSYIMYINQIHISHDLIIIYVLSMFKHEKSLPPTPFTNLPYIPNRNELTDLSI